MNKWDNRFIELAEFIANWSKDPKTKVGAVIVDNKNRIVSVGFNGLPRGIEDSFLSREEKLLKTIHAEENAILFANRSLENCVLYVTHHPCAKCTGKLIQVGISKIIYKSELSDNWIEDTNVSNKMLSEINIKLIKL